MLINVFKSKKWLIFAICSLFLFSSSTQGQTISLKGQWRFKIDAQDEGVKQKWFSTVLSEMVNLPGSMAENLKGDDITLKTKWTGSIYDSSFFYNPGLAKYRQANNIKIPFWLTPAKHYIGVAWYQKDIQIPADWDRKRIFMSLEYPHSETRVWIDDVEIGSQYTFVVAQNFELPSNLKAGKHTITLQIDNRIKAINVGQDSHSLTDHTQGNWNGVVGKMFLQATSPVYFDDIQVYPDLKRKIAKVKIQLKSANDLNANGQITLSATSFNTKEVINVKPITKAYSLVNGVGTLEVELPMGDKIVTWDEFDPALYRLKASLVSKNGLKDEKQVQFGMREFKANGRNFEINGRPVFLRGTVNNCEFPLTGYPAMDVEAWVRIFKICKAHGLNHMRFHSWCPPEAAFIAADLIGFYLQPEGPSWANHGSSIGDGKPIDKFIYDETNRMNTAYGNYASFCMMAYGNEPRGKQVEYLTKFNDYWKAKDNRKIYTGASVGGSWPIIPNNEFMVRAGARGLDWNKKPESLSTYAKQIEQFTVPFVAHEMGQYCVFPNFKEIKKYTGVYRAKNFELFEEDLKDHDMGDQAEDFLMASGKLQALCYKNEIEKAFRTPNYSGYQLLSLNDYPGQGTALIGVLDAFWDEKGYISAKEFKRFSNSTVPLIEVPKFVYTSDEKFEPKIEIAHWGKASLNAKITARLIDEAGKVVFTVKFKPTTLALGSITPIGSLKYSSNPITKPVKLKLEVAIDGTEYANDWDFWFFPPKLPTLKSDVYYTTVLDDKAQAILKNGGKVFLNAYGKVVKGKEVVQTFLPVFWNTSWFKMRPPHTLGFVTDPKNPALAEFPTSYHSDMQWWEIVNKAQVMNLEDFPKGFKPIVQPIDTWFLNRRLAMVFEAKVGNGKLIVSSANLTPDLNNDLPSARQLFYSLQKYMASDAFNPKFTVDFSIVKDVFETPSKQQFETFTKDAPDELKPKQKTN